MVEMKRIYPKVAEWRMSGTDWVNHLARVAAVSRCADTTDMKRNRRRVEHCWENGHLGVFEHWPIVALFTPWPMSRPVPNYRERDRVFYGNLRHVLESIGTQKTFPYEILDDAVVNSSTTIHPVEELRTFHITCSRACSHQLVRYRQWMSIVQESQRYVNYVKKGHEYLWFDNSVEDIEFRLQPCYAAYDVLIAKGVKPEDARYVLPNATATRLVMTAPVWEWEHVLTQRAHHRTGRAQEEISSICQRIEKLLEGDYDASVS